MSTQTDKSVTGTAAAQSGLNLEVPILHPDEMFPPIPEEELITDRRRRTAYQEQQDYLAKRAAYTELYNLAKRLTGENSSLVAEMDESRAHTAHREKELADAVRTSQNMVWQIAWIEVVVSVLTLITMRRPQTGGYPNFHATSEQVRRELSFGDIRVVLMPGNQQFSLRHKAIGTEVFTTDAQGNMSAGECRKLFGYLAEIGIAVDPSVIRKIMADSYHQETYPRSASPQIPDMVRGKPDAVQALLNALTSQFGPGVVVTFKED